MRVNAVLIPSTLCNTMVSLDTMMSESSSRKFPTLGSLYISTARKNLCSLEVSNCLGVNSLPC